MFSISWRLTLGIIGIISLPISIVWLIYEPGFEPLLAVLGAIAALIIFFKIEPEPKPPDSKREDKAPEKLLPPIWKIPYFRNSNFIGRKTLLEELHSTLNLNSSGTPTVAICGLGGVGKTQLAIEYSYRKKADYKIIWWVRSEVPETLVSDYADFAAEIDLPEKGSTDQKVIIKAVKRWLERSSGWLFVFDNAPSQEDLINYLPQGGAGHVIITSRNLLWSGIAKPLKVQAFNRAESISFLCMRTEQNDRNSADALAGELGDLPLALEQAGAYVESTGITLAEYLELLQSRRAELWRVEPPPVDYPQAVATTWSLAMDKVREESLEAADFLSLCSFFAPDEIPLELLSSVAEYFPAPLASTVADKLAMNRALQILLQYSLIDISGKKISVHRLVQLAVFDRLGEERARAWAETALRILSNAFPIKSDDPESMDMRTWPDCSWLLPHALATSKHAEVLEVAPGLTSNILNQCGSYLRERGDFYKAKELHEKALKIAEDFFGNHHPCVAICLENLGRVLRDLDELKAAKEHYERALTIDMAFYGSKHSHVAICEDGLGRVLSCMNELAAAKENFKRALEIDRVIHSPDHFKVAIRLNNIGSVLRDQGDLKAAKEYYEKALEIDEAFYGNNHPYVAIRLNNIGTVLHDQGDLKAAKEHYERALTIAEAFYGSKNIHVAFYLNNLGCALLELGDLKEAKVKFERVLNIREKVYEPNHSEIATVVSNLCFVLLFQGQIKEAKKYCERAWAIFHNSLGDDNHNTKNFQKILELLNSRQRRVLIGIIYPIKYKLYIIIQKFKK